MPVLKTLFTLFVIIVGRDAVFAVAGAREVHCGRRLVSGLFSRPRLPLGYSYITTVPRGACRLNVSEIVSSDNYIALKITNGSYIINGEFAVSTPGIYEAAGARLTYTRNSGQDVISSQGPTLEPIDIMILYTEPNPNIKYEFFTESIPSDLGDELSTNLNQPEPASNIPVKHSRRHHGYDKEAFHRDANSLNGIEKNTGSRTFMWKILSYTQCTRTCGGGIQVGKYRCVETSVSEDREVSPAHCSGGPPPGRRRRCGNIPCSPRWRTAAWSACPQCGPATRTRIVGCVQDHSRGITKISDQKCPAPKPPTSEACNIPECTPITGIKPVDKPSQDRTENFRDSPLYTVSVNASDFDIGPEYSLNTNGWTYTDWSECVGWCVGGGIQSRAMRCSDPSGCGPQQSSELSRVCVPNITCDPHDGQWFTGDWSPCSQSCNGKQVRGVLCIGGSGRHLRDSACRRPRPEHERSCGGDCSPAWYTGDWGQCTGNCSSEWGVQRRTVWCAPAPAPAAASAPVAAPAPAPAAACAAPHPPAQRACRLQCSQYTISSDYTTESQKSYPETPVTRTSTNEDSDYKKGCEDKLPNCVLAVQARLCHYKYYMQYCCDSCKPY